jgi:hypothetical protein
MNQAIESMPGGAAAPVTTFALLGAPPLISSEDRAAYEELLARICATLRPSDSLEEVWIRDLVDLVWDTFRLRRIKATMLSYRAAQEVCAILDRHPERPKMPAGWAAGYETAVKNVEQALQSVGSSGQHAISIAMLSFMQEIERLDRMLVSAEARRSAALREIDYHRGPFAQKLRRAIAEAEASEVTRDAPPIAAEAQPA